MVKIPSKITASYLENAALYYLQRFSSTSTNLRRVLMRKIDRSVAHWGGERQDFLPALDGVVQKMITLGYLNDQTYAEQKVRSLHRQGKGQRVIRATLTAKGVNGEQADQALEALDDDTPDADFQAAIRLAAKRRLGPYRPAESRGDSRNKDLATLARAGFDYHTASRVIDADSIDSLETDIP